MVPPTTTIVSAHRLVFASRIKRAETDYQIRVSGASGLLGGRAALPFPNTDSLAFGAGDVLAYNGTFARRAGNAS